MYGEKRVTDASRWYIEEMSSRVVAESGRACDRFHLGKLILRGLKDAPQHTLQIDGSTGESESFASAFERSVRCANAFKELGLTADDVIVIMAPNNLNLSIPYYAALYLGVMVAPLDRNLKIKEMKDMFAIAEPKMVFCISERVKDVQNVLDELKLESNIVTMDVNSETQRNATSLNELLKKHGAKENIQNFRASDFDPEEKTAVLMPTSGTTGLPKQACLTHKNCVVSLAGFWCRETTFPTPFKTILIMAPMQWNTCVLHLNQAPVYRYTNVMSPLEIDKEHFYELVNKYKVEIFFPSPFIEFMPVIVPQIEKKRNVKSRVPLNRRACMKRLMHVEEAKEPNQLIISPTKLASYIEPGMKDKCDLSSIRLMMIGGSAASPELMKSVQEISPNIEIRNVLGQTEAAGNTFQWGATVLGSVGDPATHIQYRLIDVDTQKDIYERNKIGELWLKGPSVFKGYYKNPEASKAAFSEDGWFKTGDLLYRDNQNYFFFVDRIKQMFKYMNHQISPVEIQNVILQHPAVLDAVVTSIPDECGDLPVACVVRKPGSNVTAQEIKDLVKNSLSDSKQLRGGVIFMDKMLMAATTKVDIRELKKIVLESDRE